MHKRLLFYISSIVILNSCALDDIERYGDPCPPKDQTGKLSYIKTQDCTAESCEGQNYKKNFDTGMCPSDVPVCAQDDSGQFYCTAIQCEQDEHIYNGHCEPDDLDHCGQHGYSCAFEVPGWDTGSCRSGKCYADSCQEGYTVSAGKCNALTECAPDQHLYKGICEEDDIYNCGSHGNVCQKMISGWLDGECRDSKCHATACDSDKGYDLSNGKCEARTGCDFGMHYYNGQCEPDDLNNCGSHGIICAELAGWVSGKCELSNSHKECQSDSECAGGVCRENECFKTECVVTECESIYDIKDGKCVPRTECGAGQHLYQNQCEPDSIDNCGDHNLQCKNIIQGWAFGTCTDKTCVPLSCATGYHLSGKTCEQDSPSACGEPPISCAPGQLCSNGDCKDDCDSSMIRCMRDSYTAVCIDPQSDNAFCGANTQCQYYTTCASGQSCLNGQCVQTSCPNPSETLCTNTQPPACVNLYASDAQNCGSCGYVCAEHPQSHATSHTCLSGTCQFQCETGYTNCGSATLPNCIPTTNLNTDANNCGSCGHTCATKDEYCQAGKCVKSTCSNSCLHNNQCINDPDHCGVSCTSCNSLPNVSSSTCDSSGSCKIVSCNASAHLYNNTCEPDSTSNCGSHDHACASLITGWAGGTCTDKQCIVTVCDASAHLYNNTCEPDSPSNCGSHNNACASLITGWADGTCTDKQCRVTACNGNYHLYNNTCEPDSSSHCGAHNVACANGETCQDKSCKCPGGYTTVNGVKAACISTTEDFLSFRNAINEGKNWPAGNDNATYTLTRNIDLGTQNSWVGAGTSSYPFKGTLLGNDRTISGTLKCNAENCGIFGLIKAESSNKAKFKDLVLSVSVTSSYDAVGGLAGSATHAEFTDITVSGSVSGKNKAGGIVGILQAGSISSTSSSAQVTASAQMAGGLIGILSGSSVTNSSASGQVIAGTGISGGLVGQGGGGSIIDSHASGSVNGTGNNYYGGLIGISAGIGITRSYATGKLSALGTCGGLAGSFTGGSIQSSYYNGTISCGTASGGIIGEQKSGSTINKSGAFGSIAGSKAGGLVGYIASDTQSISILNSFAVARISGGIKSGLIGNADAPRSSGSTLNCNWGGADFENTQNTAAVCYGTQPYTEKLPVFVYEPTYQAATNKNYAMASSAFTLSNNTPLLNGAPLLNAFKTNCSDGAWESKTCTITNGLNGAGTYTLPMPGITPNNCH